MKKLQRTLILAICMMAGLPVCAQLSNNPDKFLGNITTSYNVDPNGLKFYQYWNQITPENESKWGSVEGTRGSFNWGGADNCANYAKKYGFPFKFHAIIWGAQHPNWFNASLSVEERKKAIINWMDKMKAHYPKLDLIDVANECIAGHQADTYLFEEALGGSGKTGWDWLITAFKEAHKRWPEAVLIYNDFNTFQWNTDQFISLCTALRDGGAPIDAYGCQSHDLTDCSATNFKSACTKIQNALKMPMYISEYDIGTDDDNLQLQRYKEQIPYMWEADYCAGVTLWGWIYGATWTTNGNSGIIKNGKERPAMTWLKEYMASDKAKNAQSPYPGMKKPISLYIQPTQYKATINEETTINIEATMHNGNTVEKVEFYVANQLANTLTDAPFEVKYTPTAKGKKSLKAIVYDSEGNKYERLGAIQGVGPRSPYKGNPIELPGTIEAEDFDKGDDGIAFHDSDTKNEGTKAYRTDGEGVDIVDGNGGYAIGYTSSGEWLEYTVDVKEAGTYEYEIVASTGASNASLKLSMSKDDQLTDLTEKVVVPCLQSGNWNTYSKISGRCKAELPEGKYAIRISVTGDGVNIDKVILNHITVNNNIKVSASSSPASATVNEATTLKVSATCATAEIKNVKVYVDGIQKGDLNEAPYECSYTPKATGKQVVTAVATDENGTKSKVASYTLVVNPKRTPYKGVIALPGTIEAENFDKCGEGVSFHDSDDKDEGKANYRTDNAGVDIVKSDGRYVIGYTAAGEWLEYTVNVKEAGKYSYEATVSNGAGSNGGFKVSLVGDDGKLTTLFTKSFGNTGGWDTYTTVTGKINAELKEGQQVFRITLNSPANCNIDKIKFTCTTPTGIEEVVELPVGQCDVYTTTGVWIGKVDMNGSVSVGKQIYNLTGGRIGIYVIKDTSGKSRLVTAGRSN